ncbi:hypothetical protein PC117_g19867 [Phytophthora cactorum]|uniref:Reverse transcriptase n=1 Tax=Phytophthora cactorum TaxID=29920 RepID=A0A8T1BU38_9STRA|nr:hypothetical protein PC117_g19867 [Phytophthora cactorum]KAG4052661.1 hypothetical protein PC123_g12173 [Phytophthora cactorum]
MHVHDGVYMPVNFTSRMLKSNALNYGTGEKEVLARVLHAVGHEVGQGIDSILDLGMAEIIKCTRGEDEILGLIAVSITPRENVDSILTAIAPRKQPQQSVTAIPPTVEPSEEVLVISIDGSARVKRGGGACSAVVCRLPGWTVVAAESKYMADLTVNDAVACCWVSIDSSKWTGGP